MQSEYAVETEQLTKRFRSNAVIINLTLNIKRGEVVGILGRNGAGKSTLMRLLVGAARPTSGRIKILEREIGNPELRSLVGYLPEECPLQEFLTAGELLAIHATLSDILDHERKPLISAALDRVGIRSNSRISEMSRGNRQRLGVVMATLHGPDLIILDEPTGSLDHSGRAMVREIIVDAAAAGGTVLISSHLLTEIEQACGRIVVLHCGEVAADGRIEDLAQFAQAIDIEITALNDVALKAIEKVAIRVEYDARSPTKITVHVRNRSDSTAVAAALIENGVSVITLVPRIETLDEIVSRLTSSLIPHH